MILVLDNHDSFTHNLVDYLIRLEAEVTVIRPEDMTMADWQADWQGVLLSPGPGHPARIWSLPETVAGRVPNSLVEAVQWFAGRHIPLLGVCLGHQAIGLAFGAQLASDTEPVHGKLFDHYHSSTGLFQDIPSPHQIVRYHSLALAAETIQPPLIVTGTCVARHVGAAGQQVIMAIEHQNLPIWGIQFHPEAALTSYGLYILANWLRLSGIKSELLLTGLEVWPALNQKEANRAASQKNLF